VNSRTLAGSLAAILALGITAAACGGDSDEGGSNGTAAQPSPAGTAVNLAGVCPDPVVIQTDWNPESEYGAVYQIIGSNYTVDTSKKRVTGPLVAGGKDTGVKVEVRVGGPAIGFEAVSAQMYLDKSITLGQVNTDEAVRLSATQPTLGVVSPLEISPFMIMWDPNTYPQVNSVADLASTNAKVLYFQGDTYMEYFLDKGILRRNQVDGSYDGTPARFVSEGGKAAQAGFATSEPYIYEKEVRAWGKPVKYELLEKQGYPMYPQVLSIRTGDKAKLAPCMKKLVPVLQQAQIDFMKNPKTANDLILDLVKKYNTGWNYSPGLADYAISKMRELGIVGDGANQTLGDFEMSRVQHMVDITSPIFATQNKPTKAGLKAEDIATNEFIDQKISYTP
jgi:hypothetical protein